MLHLPEPPPNDRLLDFDGVENKFTGQVGRQTIRRRVAKGDFPPPIRIGGRVFWWESHIDAYLRDKTEQAIQAQRETVERRKAQAT